MVVFLHDGGPMALDARCPHRGAPMDEGTVGDTHITCPWHGSMFRLEDGTLERGPATTDLPVYECRFRGDVVEVRSR